MALLGVFLAAWLALPGLAQDAPPLFTEEEAKTIVQPVPKSKKMSLNACKPFEAKADGTLPEKSLNNFCDKDGTPKSLTDIAAVGFQAAKKDLMLGFRDHLVKKIEKNLQWNKALVQCFSGEKPAPGLVANDDCEGAKARARKAAQENLPLVRRHLALSFTNRVDESHLDATTWRERAKVNYYPQHKYLGGKIPELTKAEIRDSVAVFDKNVRDLQQAGMAELAPAYPCIKKEGERYRLDNPYCNDGARAVNQRVASGLFAVRDKHAQEYERLIGENPNLAFMNSVDAKESDAGRISAEEAQIYKNCVSGARTAAALESKNPRVAACWLPPSPSS